MTTFTFTGDGGWSIPGHWNNSLKPPALLPAGYSIIIDPIVNGQCILDVAQHIATGATFTVMTGKTFVLEADLFLH